MVAHSAIDHTGITGVGAGAHPVAYVTLPSTSAVSATTFANVSGMSFALLASSVYLFEYFLGVDTNATTVGIKLGVNTADAGTTIALTGFVPTTAPALNTQYAGGWTFSKDSEIFTVTAGPGGTRSLATLIGLVTTTTNADTLQLRHASETATVTSIKNGIGRLTKLA